MVVPLVSNYPCITCMCKVRTFLNVSGAQPLPWRCSIMSRSSFVVPNFPFSSSFFCLLSKFLLTFERKEMDDWLMFPRERCCGVVRTDNCALRPTPFFWRMDPITYRVSHHKLSAAKRQPEVALCLSSVCKRSSFLFRFICFFFFTPPDPRRICPLTRSCSADLYQRITAIPRRPPTQKENQIKLYSAHLFSTENY